MRRVTFIGTIVLVKVGIVYHTKLSYTHLIGVQLDSSSMSVLLAELYLCGTFLPTRKILSSVTFGGF